MQLSSRGGASSSVPGLSLWSLPRCLCSSGCGPSVLEGHVFHGFLGLRPLPHPKMNQLRVVYPLIFWTVWKHVLIVAHSTLLQDRVSDGVIRVWRRSLCLQGPCISSSWCVIVADRKAQGSITDGIFHHRIVAPQGVGLFGEWGPSNLLLPHKEALATGTFLEPLLAPYPLPASLKLDSPERQEEGGQAEPHSHSHSPADGFWAVWWEKE